MKSKLFRLDSRDMLKGLVVAVLGAVLASMQVLLSEKGLDWTPQDLTQIVQVAVTALVAYLAKNFVSDENDRLGGRF